MKKLHAFVAMPFGKKTGPEGTAIGFNAVNKNKLPKPFGEPAFIQNPVLLSGKSWRKRDFKIKPQAQIKAASIELGEPLKDVNSYECCNSWLLYTTLAYGIKKVQFCLWNGGGGDPPEGTAHIYHDIEYKTGQVYWLDTSQLYVEKKRMIK